MAAVSPALELSGPIRERLSQSSGVTTAAGVTRAQWQHFLDVYRPLEDKVIQRAMQTDFTAEGNQAGATAAAGLASAAGTYERNLRRSGTSLTAEERAAFNRRLSTSSSRSRAGAENMTRRTLSTQRLDLLADVVGTGRSVVSSASGGLNTVADLEAQRAVAREQAKTAGRNQALSTAATVAAFFI